jgi:hypothetical protein
LIVVLGRVPDTSPLIYGPVASDWASDWRLRHGTLRGWQSEPGNGGSTAILISSRCSTMRRPRPGGARADPPVTMNESRPSNGTHAELTLGEAARIFRKAVKDKSYRKTPLGQLVGRYLRWFRNEYGATDSTIRDSTIRDYEAVLARMSLLLADREPLEVSTEEEGHVPFSPASKIRRPRAPRKTAPLLPAHVDVLLSRLRTDLT